MPPFDPIASPTVRAAPHREPAFACPDQAAAGRAKLERDGSGRFGLGNGLFGGGQRLNCHGVSSGDHHRPRRDGARVASAAEGLCVSSAPIRLLAATRCEGILPLLG